MNELKIAIKGFTGRTCFPRRHEKQLKPLTKAGFLVWFLSHLITYSTKPRINPMKDSFLLIF